HHAEDRRSRADAEGDDDDAGHRKGGGLAEKTKAVEHACHHCSSAFNSSVQWSTTTRPARVASWVDALSLTIRNRWPSRDTAPHQAPTGRFAGRPHSRRPAPDSCTRRCQG